MKIDIFRKPTHSNRYLHLNSAHPLKQKETIAYGLWLRAHRILKNFPIQLAIELKFLKSTLIDSSNGYPVRMVTGWFAKFEHQLRNNPGLLQTRSRTLFEDIMESPTQQSFVLPSAQLWFENAGMDHSNSEDQNCHSAQCTKVLPEDKNDENVLPQELEETIDQQNRDPQMQMTTEPVLVIPYIPGIGDQLKRISDDFGIWTWFSYPVQQWIDLPNTEVVCCWPRHVMLFIAASVAAVLHMWENQKET